MRGWVLSCCVYLAWVPVPRKTPLAETRVGTQAQWPPENTKDRSAEETQQTAGVRRASGRCWPGCELNQQDTDNREEKTQQNRMFPNARKFLLIVLLQCTCIDWHFLVITVVNYESVIFIQISVLQCILSDFCFGPFFTFFLITDKYFLGMSWGRTANISVDGWRGCHGEEDQKD